MTVIEMALCMTNYIPWLDALLYKQSVQNIGTAPYVTLVELKKKRFSPAARYNV
jgi:hypothetical protein